MVDRVHWTLDDPKMGIPCEKLPKGPNRRINHQVEILSLLSFRNVFDFGRTLTPLETRNSTHKIPKTQINNW